MMKKVTIKEIAKITGVSSATVSRVLNNNGRFSEETKKRVMDAIRELEYRPNIVAKSLRTNKSKTIAVIVPDITNEFFASVVLAIENYCVPNGYSVFICNTSEDEEKEKLYIKDLEAKGVDGLIILSGKMDIPNGLTRRNIPVVCIDRNPNNESVVVIESDNLAGGYLATAELIRSGCKRILMIRDYREVSPMINRFLGYKKALEEFGLPFKPELVLRVNVNVNAARDAVTDAIRKGLEFDGIFAATDWLALGALLAVKEKGFKVPDDIKIVGFDNISISEYGSPPISTIHQDKEKLGHTAAEVLLSMINGETNERPRNIILPVEYVKRNTT